MLELPRRAIIEIHREGWTTPENMPRTMRSSSVHGWTLEQQNGSSAGTGRGGDEGGRKLSSNSMKLQSALTIRGSGLKETASELCPTPMSSVTKCLLLAYISIHSHSH